MILSDIKTFVEIVSSVGSWLEKARTRSTRARDLQAAQLLHDATVLVVSMRAYDNAFRPLAAAMLTFRPYWPDDRRERLANELSHFLDREEILPLFRQSLTSLANSYSNGMTSEPVRTLLQCARRFMEPVQVISASKTAYTERALVIGWLLDATTQAEAAEVHSWAVFRVSALHKEVLADAEIALAELRIALQREFSLPDLPPAVSLAPLGPESQVAKNFREERPDL
ncbi:hypothetical protein ACI797_15395 [Geodermatophilus sp. SYSU D00691]